MTSTSNDCESSQTNMKEIMREYSTGKRVFNEYEIEDDWADIDGLILDDAQFTYCFIEACFCNCSFRNTIFSCCNIKTIIFKDCDLTNAMISECAIESVRLINCTLDGIKSGTNYAYGVTLNESDSIEYMTVK